MDEIIEDLSKSDNLRERASAAYGAGDWESAIQYYGELIELSTGRDFIEFSARSAISCRNLNRYDEGRNIIADALKLYPCNRWLHIEAVVFDMHEHKWESAENLLVRIFALENTPLSALDYNRAAKVYEMVSSWQCHKSLVLKGIKLYPKNDDLKARFLLSKAISFI